MALVSTTGAPFPLYPGSNVRNILTGIPAPNPTIRGAPLAPGASPFGTTRPGVWTLTAGQSKTLADLQADLGATLSSLTVIVRQGGATITFGTGPQAMREGDSLSWGADDPRQPFGDAAFAVAADAGSEVIVTATAVIP
jgi:hypothetical protein